jgi:hypothetical protein
MLIEIKKGITYMKCTICNKPIILKPSAAERAKKFGGKASDYSALFTEHSKCALDKRNEDTSLLIHKVTEQRQSQKVTYPLNHQ